MHYVHPGTSAKAPGDKPHTDGNLKLATEREQTLLRSVAVGAAYGMAIDPKFKPSAISLALGNDHHLKERTCLLARLDTPVRYSRHAVPMQQHDIHPHRRYITHANI